MSILDILQTLLIEPIKLGFEIIFSVGYRVTGNLGAAIILLSLTMNIMLLPMYRRADLMQEEARQEDERLREGVRHIKKVFSGDQRMMILQTYYRQNQYSPLHPLKGSLSLLLEIPFFMAAYQVLSDMPIMTQMPFGPILDLSLADGLLQVGTLSLNLLPIVMTAVNLVSCVIYLKGYPLQTKLQLYGMALFFLVFLYDSPSCLVLYWTLNNIFSLGKTLVYKLKNPGKLMAKLGVAMGVAALVFGLFFYHPANLKRKIVVVALGTVLLLPQLGAFLLPGVKARFCRSSRIPQPDHKLFFSGALFAAVLTGLLIPGTFLAASPQEYVSPNYFFHPLWYLASAFCMASGVFGVWCGVFYYLATPGVKVLFGRFMWVLSGIMLVNYMFFGTDLGTVTSGLQYINGMSFSFWEQVGNLLVIVVLGAVLYALAVWKSRLPAAVLLAATLAIVGMSLWNMVRVQDSIGRIAVTESGEEAAGSEVSPIFRLSKTGQNVVVLLLDRAMGEYLPFLFAENPELQEQFAGFTYYSNVLSHGSHTNFVVPGLLGGYEYTPVEINRRDQELLREKHNEALKVMPVSFWQEGYEVTVCDPPYANYQWIPDLSIYSEYPGINAQITNGRFVEEEVSPAGNLRNFFCFSLMKSMPLVCQPFLYDGGTYNMTRGTQELGTQILQGLTSGSGVNDSFWNWYTVLQNLPDITQIEEEPVNTYLFLYNCTTHDTQLTQMPGYTVEETVDNSQYFYLHEQGLSLDGVTLKMDTDQQVMHYHINMAALIQVGQWLDFLRESGVYDNTRIIIAGDHGQDLFQQPALTRDADFTAEQYYPLLMVKDFDSQEFTTCDAFMTTADVPSLTMEGLIENPVNPFTGNPISMEEKTAHDQYVILSHECSVEDNRGNCFQESAWASVREDVRDLSNWTWYDEITVLKEHAAP